MSAQPQGFNVAPATHDGLPAPTAAGDEQLIQRISARSAEALETLYDLYSQRAYRIARSVCHDSGRAEEVVQEAFVSIWRGAATYQSQQGTVAAWLLAIVCYRAIDIARRNETHTARRACDDALATPAGPGDEAELAVTRADARPCSARLRSPGSCRTRSTSRPKREYVLRWRSLTCEAARSGR